MNNPSGLITSMSREDFEKNFRGDKGKGNVKVFEDTKNRIYGKSSPWLNKIVYNWMYNIDLE